MGRQPVTSYDAAVAPDPTQLIDRLTPIGGSTPRLVALLAYDTKPGTCSSELLRRVRSGRASARSN